MSTSSTVQPPRGQLRGHGNMQCTGSTRQCYRISRSLLYPFAFNIFSSESNTIHSFIKSRCTSQFCWVSLWLLSPSVRTTRTQLRQTLFLPLKPQPTSQPSLHSSLWLWTPYRQPQQLRRESTNPKCRVNTLHFHLKLTLACRVKQLRSVVNWAILSLLRQRCQCRAPSLLLHRHQWRARAQ